MVLVMVIVVAAGLATWGIRRQAAASSPARWRAPEGGGSVPTGSSDHTISIGGHLRSFHVYRPATLPAGAVPLVVMLHGGFGDGLQAQRTYGWDAQADRDHFVVVYPDGLNHAWSVGGGCCGAPGRAKVNDVAFITAVVERLRQKLPIDVRRIYATGISNGGMLAYRLACDSDIFAAIGPNSATLLGSCTNPKPISVIHIHGTADRTIRFDGGRGQGVAQIDGPPIPSVNAMWRSIDRCDPPSITTSGAVTISLANCPDGRTVELITIAGAGHQWPGAPSRPVVQRLLHTDPPSNALDATATIWQFFADHPKPT
jgi:polyhydroxybutyrate depolymerase